MSYASPDDVARRAYSLWETQGRPHGQDKAHWEQAERELAITTDNSGQSAPPIDAAAAVKKATRRAPAVDGVAGIDGAPKPKRAPRRTAAAKV